MGILLLRWKKCGDRVLSYFSGKWQGVKVNYANLFLVMFLAGAKIKRYLKCLGYNCREMSEFIRNIEVPSFQRAKKGKQLIEKKVI